ncbi:MAG: hypothetical protein IPP93_18385 [Chitinophagaceae bacterium]|nr:hypothetical protein [Chitinophagaceae bacterium]
MQFEEFDNKIREAAEHHHPVYQEDAWGKMEKMLDKHMPVEKDRKRRVFFFILFALLLGGAAWFLNDKLRSGKSAVAVNTAFAPAGKPATDAKQTTAEENNTQASGTESVVPADNNSSVTANKQTEPNTAATGSGQPVTGNVTSSNNATTGTNNYSLTTNAVAVKQRNSHSFNPSPVKLSSNKSRTITVQDQQMSVSMDQPSMHKAATNKPANSAVITQDNNFSAQTTPASSDQSLASNKPVEPVKAAEPVIPSVKEENKTVPKPENSKTAKTKSKKTSHFFVFASAAPDVSYTSNSGNAGALKLAVGGGIGYIYKGKLGIRAGFFTARKEYTAPPDAYHGNAAFYSYYPNLQSIDGNCKVYEIPVLLTYHFGGAKQHSWFAGAGLSSYLMKSETYTYFYKPVISGPVVNRSYSITNKNKHYFSVLDLSAGYTRKLGKSFSISAEPYVKLPMSGVGLGKVKLNSAGVMFSVGFSPFQQKK